MSKKKIKSLIESIVSVKREAGIVSNFRNETIPGIKLIPLNERIQLILEMNKKAQKMKPTDVYFLLFYDIENNKVRTRIAKYLIKQGCERIQKSVYMALLSRKMMMEMQEALSDIQAMYENSDSIIFLPIGSEQVNAMKLIGQNINISLTFEQKSTLFI